MIEMYRFIEISSLEIKPRTDLGEHKEAIKGFMRQLSPDWAYSGSDVEELTDNRWLAVIFALDSEGNAVGFGTLRRLDKSGVFELERAFVEPRYRRKGIYKEILRRRIDIARKLGAKSLLASVNINKRHLKYLRSVGFKPVGMSGALMELKVDISDNQS